MVPFRRIVAPTDFSPCSRKAFELAAQLAEHHSAELVLLHVLDLRGLLAEATSGVLDYQHFIDEKTASVDAAFAKLVAELPVAVATRTRTVFRQGVPTETIVDAIAEHDADLIVMGTHGHSGLTRLLVGSVAGQVMRQATCPVLVVRQEEGSD